MVNRYSRLSYCSGMLIIPSATSDLLPLESCQRRSSTAPETFGVEILSPLCPMMVYEMSEAGGCIPRSARYHSLEPSLGRPQTTLPIMHGVHFHWSIAKPVMFERSCFPNVRSCVVETNGRSRSKRCGHMEFPFLMLLHSSSLTIQYMSRLYKMSFSIIAC